MRINANIVYHGNIFAVAKEYRLAKTSCQAQTCHKKGKWIDQNKYNQLKKGSIIIGESQEPES